MLWGDGGDIQVENFLHDALLLDYEMQLRLMAEPRAAYGVLALRRPAVCRNWLHRLAEAGVMKFSFETFAEQADISFVGKSGGRRQQMDVNCRRCKVHWQDAAGVVLATGDARSRRNIAPGEAPFAGKLGINGDFYHMELP